MFDFKPNDYKISFEFRAGEHNCFSGKGIHCQYLNSNMFGPSSCYFFGNLEEKNDMVRRHSRCLGLSIKKEDCTKCSWFDGPVTNEGVAGEWPCDDCVDTNKFISGIRTDKVEPKIINCSTCTDEDIGTERCLGCTDAKIFENHSSRRSKK
jgi:hypothetical protein